jgi:hypothetical protein
VSDYTPNEAEKLLIAALRSGQYEQAQSVLRDEEGFCCLGVAEDVLNPEPWRRGGIRSDRWIKGDGTTYYLTPAVKSRLGWSDSAGVLRGATNGNCLAFLNDQGASFAEIADIIERGEVLREASK